MSIKDWVKKDLGISDLDASVSFREKAKAAVAGREPVPSVEPPKMPDGSRSDSRTIPPERSASPPEPHDRDRARTERAGAKARIRLQDGEEVVFVLKRTGWDAKLLKVVTLGLYVPWWKAASFVVTNHRLITKKGLLNKAEVSLPLRFVQDASVHRSWYGIGRVDISTAGGSEGLSRIEMLKPTDARQLADTVMSEAKHVVPVEKPLPRDAGDVTEALVLLAGLRDSGALTEDEFAQQKARVLQQSAS